MKTRILISLLALVSLPAAGLAQVEPATFYFGLEMRGELIGYLEMESRPGTDEHVGAEVIESRTFAKMTLLGQDFDLQIRTFCAIDAATGRLRYLRSSTEQGTLKMGSKIVVAGDEAKVFGRDGSLSRTITLGEDIQFDNSLHYRWLLREVGEGKASQKTFKILDSTTSEVHDVTWTYKGKAEIELAGTAHDTLRFGMVDRKMGVTGDVWFDPKTAVVRKATLANGVTLYRTDANVVGNIKRAEMDDSIFARVGVGIADYTGITYMKVKAKIVTIGEWVTAESLNVPGQKFIGTVKDNVIDGVFEIEYPRYSGESAPPFPPEVDPELKKYLEPEDLVESNDPGIVKKALELTEGSRDSWEAAKRLSKWVADEIRYEIPGGSARQTYETRKGECGSHSRLLVAFLRAVDIPARLACGCMYTPHYGGSFGQHAWTEVWMGKAGWIPVDSTAHEIDFVDSGHIRLGSETTFSPKKMEILDYRPRPTGAPMDTARIGFKSLPWKIGKTYTYTYSYKGRPLGTDSFTIESYEQKDGRGVYTARTKLALQGREASGTWKIDDAGRPISYHAEGKVRTTEYTIDCAFSKGQVVEKAVQGDRPIERTIKLEGDVYLLDNNNFSLYAFLVSGLPFDSGTTVTIDVFHPSAMQVFPTQITVTGNEELTVAGKKIPCRKCKVVLAGTTLELWVDEKGRIVKETEADGKLVVALKES